MRSVSQSISYAIKRCQLPPWKAFCTTIQWISLSLRSKPSIKLVHIIGSSKNPDLQLPWRKRSVPRAPLKSRAHFQGSKCRFHSQAVIDSSGRTQFHARAAPTMTSSEGRGGLGKHSGAENTTWDTIEQLLCLLPG